MTGAAPEAAPAGRLAEVARVFLKLGVTAFGGPAAHLAMMEEEVVRRRRWVTREEFVDLLGAANLIPGPNSTEMALHLGLRRAGPPGLLVAGGCFIVPAALITLALAAAYVRWGQLPAGAALLRGASPVILAVVLQALVRLLRGTLRTPLLGALATGAAAASLLGAGELPVLLGSGLVSLALSRRSPACAALSTVALVCLALPAQAAVIVTAAARVPYSAARLFLTFAKIGSVLYGSGYVLLAFVRTEFVARLGWLDERQLLDAVSAGQLTPGPVFTTATFIGYLVGRTPGALWATLGIFLPAFLFVALSGPLVPRLRRSPAAGAFLDGVNAASLALMAVVLLQLGRAALVDLPTLAIGAGAALLLLGTRVGSVWLLLGGAGIGWLLFR